ncbi:uncharacterized protein LOC127448724 isoform X1 [Myxocyprinus asiaticus]|uniref:uncharacterized protein LOC127448724 isoform X1 n=1 Tax=Myxocyprinus asiaticus TaxID=70543 RepID=UPI00222327C6|nr:uncharacterized protein LOC127448724 isoform X1 [Myxocyprinus asiaticus]
MTETWFSALLLSVTSLVLLQADECIVGVIGENALLPCVYNGVKNLTFLHISSEWKKGMDVIHSSVWTEGQVELQNVSHSIRTTVSSLAPKTGDFSMELHDIHLSDTHNYSFHLKLDGQDSSPPICTVCLNVEAGVRSIAEVGRLSEAMWMFSTALCVVVFLLVALSLGFQIKWDRDRRREHHRCGDDSSSEGTEMILMDMEQWMSLPETDV